MKWKNRLTNYNFWISIISAALLILQAFKFEFDIAYINEIATAVLGLMVVIGIISDPTKTYSSQENVTKNSSKETPQEGTKKEEVAKRDEADVIQLPIETEIKSVDDNVENDFQILMNKISADISENLAKINELSNSIKRDMVFTQNNVVENDEVLRDILKVSEDVKSQPPEAQNKEVTTAINIVN